MRLSVDDIDIGKVFKSQYTIFVTIALIFLLISGFSSRTILRPSGEQEVLANLSEELEEMVAIEEDEIEEEVVVEDDADINFVAGTSSRRNPFQSLLREEVVEVSRDLEEDSDGKEVDSREQALGYSIEILGILKNDLERVAILKVGDGNTGVQIVRRGSSFLGMSVKEVKDDGVLIEKDGSIFVYIFGGEKN